MMEVDTMAQAMIVGTGAPARPEQMWLQANWLHITAEARRLQVRIAKATLEGRWGKVKTLQRLLTCSHSGKMLAVKRVTENRGKRTPGRGRQDMVNPGGQVERDAVDAASRLSHEAASTYLHPQEQRQEASAGNSLHAL